MNPVDVSGDPSAQYKRLAAERAVTLVRSGMVVGLGTGTTASFAIRALATALRAGKLRDIVVVPSSEATAALTRELGMTLTDSSDVPRIDLTIDGADEVDTQLRLIKGAGGALLREKMLAQASARVVIVVHDDKLSQTLGTLSTLPVEVVAYGWLAQQRFLETLGARVELRKAKGGQAFETDQQNLILDCRFAELAEPEALAAKLDARAGIVEHGLFIGLATDLISGGDTGVRHIGRAAR